MPPSRTRPAWSRPLVSSFLCPHRLGFHFSSFASAENRPRGRAARFFWPWEMLWIVFPDWCFHQFSFSREGLFEGFERLLKSGAFGECRRQACLPDRQEEGEWPEVPSHGEAHRWGKCSFQMSMLRRVFVARD